jgi:hypothetical protein
MPAGSYTRNHVQTFVVEVVSRHFVDDIVPPMLIDESMSARTSILCPEPCFLHLPTSQTTPLHLHEDRRQAAARDRLRQAMIMLFRRRLQSRKCSRKPGQGVVRCEATEIELPATNLA